MVANKVIATRKLILNIDMKKQLFLIFE